MKSWLNIQNKAEKAVIEITGEIRKKYQYWDDDSEDTSAADVEAAIKEIENIKSAEIEVLINSMGGDVNQSLQIYNALISTGAKITTIYKGWSASAAVIVGMAGSERKAADNLMILIHEGQSGVYGVQSEFEAQVNVLKNLNKSILKILAQNGNESKIKKQMQMLNGYGTWNTAAEMLELGILTEVTENDNSIKNYSNQFLNKYNLPNIENMAKKEDESTIDKIKGFLNIQNDEALKNENAGFKNEIEALKNKATENETAYQNLKAGKETSDKENETLKAEKAAFENKIKALEADKVEQQGKIDALEFKNKNIAPPDPKVIPVKETEEDKKAKEVVNSFKNRY